MRKYELWAHAVLSPLAEELVVLFSDIATSSDFDNEYIDFAADMRVPKPAPCPPELNCPICQHASLSTGPHHL